MRAVCLYAITDHPEMPAPRVPGLGDAPLEQVTHQDVGATVSTLSARLMPSREADLWRFETVLEALMADRAVLPMRFGSTLPDPLAVQTMLQERYSEFRRNLDEVRGRVEVSLRVLWQLSETEPPHAVRSSPAAKTGRAYLMERLESERREGDRRSRAEALAQTIHGPLAEMAARSVRRVLITPHLLLTAAYLIERGRMEDLLTRVRVLEAVQPQLRFLCTGPWPPYSFVTAAEAPKERLDAANSACGPE